MSKLIKGLFILLLVIFLFNKNILSFLFVKKFESWVERQVKIEKIYFDYSGLVIVEKLKILNSSQNYYDNLLKAEKIVFIIDIKSIFSDLIIVKSLNIKNPEFFLDINYNEIVKENQKNVINDNIGLAKKLNEKLPDKVWPKKKKDVNFLIRESSLTSPKANIKISSISKPITFSLSDMKFTEFGNDERYRHYKDVLKSILFDLYARVSDRGYKKILKQIYNF
tara:strand:+ start:2973 stop:3641 length:669 start_codon:yes stop_codon:yes gene_type:complete